MTSLFSSLSRPGRRSFTIVELLVVIVIIALLGSVTLPGIQSSILQAQTTRCTANLHNIGIAVLQSVTDNNGCFPQIDQAAEPVYSPAGSVLGLVGVLGRYGLTTNDTQCPVDMAMGDYSSFKLYQSSYEWNPVLDGGTDPTTSLGLEGVPVTADSSRIRLCVDFEPIHRNKKNALYGDGHVTSR